MIRATYRDGAPRPPENTAWRCFWLVFAVLVAAAVLDALA
jgi:hypothetical protein